jgi:hypothetical protein
MEQATVFVETERNITTHFKEQNVTVPKLTQSSVCQLGDKGFAMEDNTRQSLTRQVVYVKNETETRFRKTTDVV